MSGVGRGGGADCEYQECNDLLHGIPFAMPHMKYEGTQQMDVGKKKWIRVKARGQPQFAAALDFDVRKF
jgi:hypothetical protein